MNTLAVDLSDTHMVGRALRVLHNELSPPSFILPLLYACKWSLREKTGLCVNRRKDRQSSHSKILELRQLKSSFSKTPGLPATGSLLSCLWHNYLYIGVRVPVDSVISGCLDQDILYGREIFTLWVWSGSIGKYPHGMNSMFATKAQLPHNLPTPSLNTLSWGFWTCVYRL